MFNILCPHCGKSHYIVRYTTTTAMYFPVIIKDGINTNTNPDRNITTTHCECMSCSTLFSYEECGGDLLSITLDFFPGCEIRNGRPIDATIGTNPNDLRL